MCEVLYTVEISNLNYVTSEEDLRRLLSDYGSIAALLLPKNPLTNENKGCATVKFYKKSAAINAAYYLNGEVFHGRILQVTLPDKKMRKNLRNRTLRQHRPKQENTYFTIKVDNLSYRTNEEDLRKKFQVCGTIADIYLPRVRYTSMNKGFGFVKFFKKSHANNAIENMDRTTLNGRTIKIFMARYGNPPLNRKFLSEEKKTRFE